MIPFKQFVEHQDLPTSQLREDYLQGKTLNLDEKIILRESGEEGTIRFRGTNYVIVETTSGRKRCWLDSVITEGWDENARKTEQKLAGYAGKDESKHWRKIQDLHTSAGIFHDRHADKLEKTGDIDSAKKHRESAAAHHAKAKDLYKHDVPIPTYKIAPDSDLETEAEKAAKEGDHALAARNHFELYERKRDLVNKIDHGVHRYGRVYDHDELSNRAQHVADRERHYQMAIKHHRLARNLTEDVKVTEEMLIEHSIVDVIKANRANLTKSPVDLADGVYEGIRYGYTLDINGNPYETSSGVQNTKAAAVPEKFNVKGGCVSLVTDSAHPSSNEYDYEDLKRAAEFESKRASKTGKAEDHKIAAKRHSEAMDMARSNEDKNKHRRAAAHHSSQASSLLGESSIPYEHLRKRADDMTHDANAHSEKIANGSSEDHRRAKILHDDAVYSHIEAGKNARTKEERDHHQDAVSHHTEAADHHARKAEDLSSLGECRSWNVEVSGVGSDGRPQTLTHLVEGATVSQAVFIALDRHKEKNPGSIALRVTKKTLCK